MRIKCCYKCEKRTARCHVDCEDYIAEKKAYDSEVKAMAQQNYLSYGYNQSVGARLNKMVRKHRPYKK